MGERYAYVVAAAVGDPSSERLLWSAVAVLIVLGLALIALAVWVFRATRPVPPMLAPLAVMSRPEWRRADPDVRRASIEHARPDGAEPLVPGSTNDTDDLERPPVLPAPQVESPHEGMRPPIVNADVPVPN